MATATATYSPQGKITTYQIKRIMKNCNFNMDIKNEWVQWATDSDQTSLRNITQDQAVKIIKAQEGIHDAEELSWAKFDKTNKRHLKILSLLLQAGWSKPHQTRKEVADLQRFESFLKSVKSPVKKPLKDMSSEEVEKIIAALNGIVKHRWK